MTLTIEMIVTVVFIVIILRTGSNGDAHTGMKAKNEKLMKNVGQIDSALKLIYGKNVNDKYPVSNATDIIKVLTKLRSAVEHIQNQEGMQKKLIENVLSVTERLHKQERMQKRKMEKLLRATERLQKQQKLQYNKIKRIYKCQYTVQNPVEVANSKPTAMSSIHYTNHAFSPVGVNGNLTDMFHTKKEWNAWWYVDLQRMYGVHHVEIVNRISESPAVPARLRNLDILVGRTLGTLQKCGHFAGPGKNGQRFEVICHHPIKGRFVKLINKSYNYFHLAEVMVFVNLC